MIVMNTAALAVGHTQLCLRIARWFLEKHFEGMHETQKWRFWTKTPQISGFGRDQLETKLPATMTFKHTERFVPDRLKTNDVHTQKPTMTFLDQNSTTIWVLRCEVQDKFPRDEKHSYLRWLTSGRSAGRDQILPYLKCTHCVCNKTEPNGCV